MDSFLGPDRRSSPKKCPNNVRGQIFLNESQKVLIYTFPSGHFIPAVFTIRSKKSIKKDFFLPYFTFFYYFLLIFINFQKLAKKTSLIIDEECSLQGSYENQEAQLVKALRARATQHQNRFPFQTAHVASFFTQTVGKYGH